MRPLAIDLFSGLGGWTAGLTAAGWYVIRFDLEDMCRILGEPQPEHSSLVIQDVLTLHGRQFKDVGLIVSSSPCQEFSYRAMPWKRAKALGPPELGMKLFHAQFRIQREASEAAGRHIPMVVENVRGANPWVGRAKYHYGSYYLWGDVPALMPACQPANKGNSDGTNHGQGSWFAVADSKNRGVKTPGFRFDGSGRSFQTASVEGVNSDASRHDRQHGHKSPARKAASAKIAKIPFSLASWIGRAWWPVDLPRPTDTMAIRRAA